MSGKSGHTKGGGHLKGIVPRPITGDMTLTEIMSSAYFGHNAKGLRDSCELFARTIVDDDVRIGVSMSGALTPIGLGESALIPMIEANLVDWIVSTGANLYHDLHALLGFEMKMLPLPQDDRELHEAGLIRIHNIAFDQQALYDTDAFVRDTMKAHIEKTGAPPRSSADLHEVIGARLLDMSKEARKRSVLASAAAHGVPVYTPAVGDSSIGMNLAALSLIDGLAEMPAFADVNETSAIVWDAKRSGKKSAVVIFGGGTPKNFVLQTEPHIQEVLGIEEKGHDYFIQFTDARVDTGGLSGATPSEAVTWGKIDPEQLPDTVVCYGDCSVYVPLFVAYTLANAAPRKAAKLSGRMESLVAELRTAAAEAAQKGCPGRRS